MSKNLPFFDALGINIKINDDSYVSDVKELMIDFNHYFGFPPISEKRVHRNYQSCIIWECDDFKIFVNYLGFTKNQGVFVEVKGFIGCQSLVNFLMSHGWRWSLTRADVAIDFLDDTKNSWDDTHSPVFHKLQCDLMDYAEQKDISVKTVGDWLYQKESRTLYVGTRGSSSMIRLYTKSLEQKAKGNDNYPENVIRLEVEFRPTTLQKKHINVLTPQSILSLNRNLVYLFNKYLDNSISSTPIPVSKKKTNKDSLDYAINLYKNKILDFIDEVGYYQAIKYFLKKIKCLYLLKKGE